MSARIEAYLRHAERFGPDGILDAAARDLRDAELAELRRRLEEPDQVACATPGCGVVFVPRRKSDAGQRKSQPARRTYPTLMPTKVETVRSRAVLALAKQHLPVAVEFDQPEITDNDWRLVAPGLIGGAASMLESIFRLSPPRNALSVEALTRSLADYLITFAWIAVPNSRAQSLDRFEFDEYAKQESADKKYRKVFPERSKRYKKLIKAGKMPSELLDDGKRKWIARRRKVIGSTEMPPLLDRAFLADEYWMDHNEAVEHQPLAHVYVMVFVRHSAVAHASPTAVARVASSRGGVLSVGEPTADSIKSAPYSLATVLFGLMLHIASDALGWPSKAEIDTAFAATQG